jgi:predicted DNA-binding protein
MSQVINVNISDKMARELKNLSEETQQTKAFHIRKAVEVYVTKYSDYRIALRRLQNEADEIISNKQMKEFLGL